MPTLLRAAITLLSSGALFGGLAVLAIGGTSAEADAFRLVLGALGVTALATPPMLAGVFASYWSWDGSARRRVRILLAALIAIQVVGAVVLITQSATPLVVVLIVVAAALDPACIALGRAARRIELRRQPPADDLEEFRTRIRAGWRRGAIGAAIGIALGVVGIALLLPLAEPGEAPRLLLFSLAGGGLGASFGMVSITVGLGRRIRDLLGGDYSAARRIGRAVNGKREELSDDERSRAARYAVIAPAWLRLQTTQTLVNSIAVAAILLESLGAPGRPSGLAWFGVGVLVLTLATIVATLVLRRFQTRRFARYAEAHPLPA